MGVQVNFFFLIKKFILIFLNILIYWDFNLSEAKWLLLYTCSTPELQHWSNTYNKSTMY